MAQAQGIAKIIAGLGSDGFTFRAQDGSQDIDGTVPLTGSWTQSSTPDADTITWQGADPSFTASASRTADVLFVSYTNVVDDRIANILHTGVPLTSGDTITYTSIEISFGTTDPPI